jgi:hypothetical protein
MRLMMQSQEQLGQVRMQAQAPMPTASANVFQYQFQRQLQTIQQQQSMSPYVAQAYAQAMPWAQQYQGGILPSPLTMTPPSTGIFRPPPPPVVSPISPMHTPPMIANPFTPQPTSPMFRTPYEQYYQGAEQQQNRMFAMGSQAPGFAGQALAYGGGAFAGAKIGGAIGGRWGAVAGALGGAMFAGRSGFAEGVGDVFKMPFQPMVEQRQMGAALQRMSQDWVVTGDQLAPGGRGLSRGAGIDLARGFQGMAADRGFRQETGGMFNREDLMKMTGLSGQAGLLDMSQNVPQIQSKMREIAKNVRDFMQLTNDPDVTNVIREMGRMQSFGLTGGQITQAAQNMRYFSRAAGTSIQGLQQMGGLPGAMTYQGVGLSAGQGFEYGNYSAAMARQAVASGTYSQQQLALMGGVQGITQRNTQAQAAFMSMPLFGAAMSGYGQGGWGAAGGGLQGGGAFGMVNQAMGAMNQGVRQGGLGALAMFPLQQRDIQSQVAANMTPEEQTAMRFKLAMQTGQRLGLKGEGAFAAGARIAYGNDVAEDMLYQAKNPQFWGAQKDMISQRRTELAFSQRAQDKERAEGVFSPVGRGLTAAGAGFSDIGRGFKGAVGGVAQGIGNWWEDMRAREKGQIIQRRDRRLVAGSPEERRALAGYADYDFGYLGAAGTDYDYSNRLVGMANDQVTGTRDVAKTIGTGARGLLSMAGPGGMVAGLVDQGLQAVGVDAVGDLQDAVTAANLDSSEKEDMVRSATKQWRRRLAVTQRSRAGGKEREAVLSRGAKAAMGDVGGSSSWGREALRIAGKQFAIEVESRSGILGIVPWAKDKIDDTMIAKFSINAISASRGVTKEQAAVIYKKMDPAAKRELEQAVVNEGRAAGGPGAAEMFNKWEEGARSGLSEASETRIAQLRKGAEMQVKALESKLDMTRNFGVGADLWEKTGAQEFREEVINKAGKTGFAYSELEVAAMATAGSVENDTAERRAEIKKLWLAQNKGKKPEQFDTWYDSMREKAQKQLSPAALERLTGMLGEGGTVGQITKLVGTSRALKGKEQFLAGAEQLKNFGFDINDALNNAGRSGIKSYKDLDVEHLVGAVSEDTLKQMRDKGGAYGKEADLIAKAKSGDKKSTAALKNLWGSRGQVSEKKVSSATEAGGSEAEKLNRSDAALSDMQATFAGFAPAVDDFKSGAKMFREAMETEWLSRQK